MNTSEIEVLLAKFYEGRSSLQEEKTLRDFFRRQDVPIHLKSHQSLFTYYGSEQKTELNDRDFDKMLSSLPVDEPLTSRVITLHARRNRLMFITSIAASVLLLIGLFFTFQHDGFKMSSKLSGGSDPEIAYADASKALMLVSGNLNHGLKQVERLHMVDEVMNELEHFNKFYQYESIIINPDKVSNQSIKSK
jgi:hypothetical protein